MSKSPLFPPKPRTVLFVLFPGFQIVDAAGPIGAFEIAARYVPGAYTLKLAATNAGLIPSSAGVAMPAETLTRAKVDTFIVVGGDGTRAAIHDARLIGAIKARDIVISAGVNIGNSARPHRGLIPLHSIRKNKLLNPIRRSKV